MTATTVSSNGVEIPFDHRYFAPMRDSSDIAGDPSMLRERFADDGYLYLPRHLDPELSWELRADYFARFDRGYLRPGSRPADGLFSGSAPEGLPSHGVAGHPAHAFVRSEAFEAFVGQPSLQRLAEAVLGSPARRLPRSIARHFDRAGQRASRAHVDFTYLDRGTDQLVTMWIPFGDCPMATGGLVYLEGSHSMRPEEFEPLKPVTDRPHDDRPISHDLELVSRTFGRRWLWTDFSAGDVALHSPHLVHASLDTTTDAMRLSADIRYIRDGEGADPRWLQAWAGDDGN